MSKGMPLLYGHTTILNVHGNRKSKAKLQSWLIKISPSAPLGVISATNKQIGRKARREMERFLRGYD